MSIQGLCTPLKGIISRWNLSLPLDMTSREERFKWADKCAVEQLLVGYYQCHQYQQRMEREHEQWQREQQQ
jgi:hypothetical protein